MKTVNPVQEFHLSSQCRSDFICGYKVFPSIRPSGAMAMPPSGWSN